MDSVLYGRPLQDAITALVASDRTDTDISELLIRMGKGSAAAAHSTEWG